VLVHGACHGAWCWYKIAASLKSHGHRVTALDMTASGVHPKQVQELNSISEYFEPLMEFLESLPQEERVILVGHSMGGVGISMAMETFPRKVAVAVFVSALMPGPDFSYLSLMQEWLSSGDSDLKTLFDENTISSPNGTLMFGAKFLASSLYQLSPPQDLILATLLMRPTRKYADKELLQEQTRVTRDNYGSVAKVYIVCEQDIVLKQDLQLSMIERNSPNDVKVIEAADHMSMFSKPNELFSYLQEIANTYD